MTPEHKATLLQAMNENKEVLVTFSQRQGSAYLRAKVSLITDKLVIFDTPGEKATTIKPEDVIDVVLK